MRVVILTIELLLDALLELPEDLFERLFLFRERYDFFVFLVQFLFQLLSEVEDVVFVREEILLPRRLQRRKLLFRADDCRRRRWRGEAVALEIRDVSEKIVFDIHSCHLWHPAGGREG